MPKFYNFFSPWTKVRDLTYHLGPWNTFLFKKAPINCSYLWITLITLRTSSDSYVNYITPFDLFKSIKPNPISELNTNTKSYLIHPSNIPARKGTPIPASSSRKSLPASRSTATSTMIVNYHLNHLWAFRCSH